MTTALTLKPVPDEEVHLSLDERTVEAAREAAARAGLTLSAWMSHAVESTALYENGLAGIREYEDECGEITQEDRGAAAALIERLSQETDAGGDV